MKLTNYTNPVLMFSGGKDSLACLFRLEEQLKDIIVVWVNTGKNFPEVEDTINSIKHMCPRFVELRVDRDAQWQAFGMPSDIINPTHTLEGHRYTSSQFLMQSAFNCCVSNIMQPVYEFMVAIGSNLLIKGQRFEDEFKDRISSGDKVGNLVIWHPIENWTTKEVKDYLVTKMEKIPAHLELKHSSMDCYDCTAYLDATQDRLFYMKKHHPEKLKELKLNLEVIRNAVLGPLESLDEILG